MSRFDESLRESIRAPRLESGRTADRALRLNGTALDTGPLGVTAPSLPAHGGAAPGTSAIGESRLLGHDEMSPVALEQYRRVAAVLHELHLDRGFRTLLVTSALPREGKTFTIVNLALTLSEAYQRRVLVIDADLRRPSVHSVLGIQVERGLIDVLDGTLADPPILTVTPTLSLLPAGTPRAAAPLAGLSSQRMRDVVGDLSARYDFVLLDTPPVGLLPDAQLLTRLAEGVLFVIRAGVTPFPAVERAIAALGRECLVGTALNAVEDDAIPVAAYYAQYYGAEPA
jgi:protein-tyrosine kinase